MAASVGIGPLVWPVFRLNAASSTLSLTPTSGSDAPRATKSVVLTSTPAAFAACAKFVWAAASSSAAAFVFAASSAFAVITSFLTLSFTSSSVGACAGFDFGERDERVALVRAERAAHFAHVHLEGFCRDGVGEPEPGQRLVAREEAGVADRQALRFGDLVEVGRRLDLFAGVRRRGASLRPAPFRTGSDSRSRVRTSSSVFVAAGFLPVSLMM